jgi:hypothetical protein
MKHLIALTTAALLASGATHAEPKMCPHLVAPVCALKGAERSTFNNSCEADVAGAHALHDGACEGGDMCSMIYKPVCGLDPASGQQKTYSSLCVSEHANAKIAHDGECKTP